MVRRLSSSLSPSLSPCWQSLQRLFQMVIRGVGVISMAKLFGLLGTAWAVGRASTNTGSFQDNFQVGGSCQLLLAVTASPTGLLTENMLPLFRHWLSSRVKFFECLINLGQQQALLFFMWHEIFYGIGKSCCQPKQHPSLCSIFQSVIGLWVEIWLGTKTACSESNPVQSSRSKSMTCPRKVHLLKFK